MMDNPRRLSVDVGGPAQESSETPPVFARFHSFKEFIALQKDTLEPGRAVDLYDQYRYDFRVHSARSVFQESQEMGFVVERFSPERVNQHAAKKIRRGRAEAAEFLRSLQAGMFQTLNLDYTIQAAGLTTSTAAVKLYPHLTGRVIALTETSSFLKSDIEASPHPAHGGEQGPYFIRNLNQNNNIIVLRRLPGDVTAEDIENVCSGVNGFREVSLIPSCWLEENQATLMVQAAKYESDCSEQDLQTFEKTMSDCYVRTRGVNSPLTPLQTAWIEFETPEDAAAAELALDRQPIKDLCSCRPMRLRARSDCRLRVTSIANDNRLLQDMAQTTQLILKLDDAFRIYEDGNPEDLAAPGTSIVEVLATKEEGVEKKDDEEKPEGNPAIGMGEGFSSAVPQRTKITETTHPLLSLLQNAPPKQRLDVQLLYLRRVHCMDFYSGRLCWNERELFETCSAMTVRLSLPEEDDILLVKDSNYILTPTAATAFNKRAEFLLKFSYEFWIFPINDKHPLFLEYWQRFCYEKTVQVDSEKYRCGICRKLFKGAEFVHKHLANKHGNESDPLRKLVRTQVMIRTFDSDDSNLLLFVVRSNDYLRVFQNNRPPLTRASEGGGSGYGPQRRSRAGSRFADHRDRPYRDWDAPRSRLEEKSAGGNFRKLIRYDDL